VETSAAVSLWETFATAPDHRRAKGKRYPLASLLLIAIAACWPCCVINSASCAGDSD
jgi:hypothetical protein